MKTLDSPGLDDLTSAIREAKTDKEQMLLELDLLDRMAGSLEEMNKWIEEAGDADPSFAEDGRRLAKELRELHRRASAVWRRTYQ